MAEKPQYVKCDHLTTPITTKIYILLIENRFSSFFISLFVQGEGKERGESPTDQVQECPVEGGLGSAVRGQALHHHHRRKQEQRGATRVSQQPQA